MYRRLQKFKAITAPIEYVFDDVLFERFSIETGVSDQPMGAEEIYLGAINPVMQCTALVLKGARTLLGSLWVMFG